MPKQRRSTPVRVVLTILVTTVALSVALKSSAQAKPVATPAVISAVQPACDGATLVYPAQPGGSLSAGDVGRTSAKDRAWFSALAARHVTWLRTLSCTAMPNRRSAGITHNWSGWVISPTYNYGSIYAGWTVPGTTGNLANPADSAMWAGQGGFNGNGDLPQAGTESDQPLLGGTTVYAWWEIYPDNTQQRINNFPIHVGDSFSEADDVSGPPVQTASFSMCDIFTNQCVYIQKNTKKPVGGSAEWILERPTVGSNYTKLANTGAVYFLDPSFTVYTNLYPSNGAPYDMRSCNNATQLAAVGPYYPAQHFFGVAWRNYGSVEHCN